MAATTQNCTAPCHLACSPLLPWLLEQPVDGEGEEVVQEDEDAEAEEQEVDDHLDGASPRSAASSPPVLARLCLRGKSRLDWQRPAAQETYTQYTLSIHTHSNTLNIFSYHFFGKKMF